MVPRAHWKGFLKLSLVSCPIALYPAIAKTERISFRQVNRQTGNRLRQQLVDAVTGEAVASGQKARGYEVGENQFLLVSDQELEAAEQEARRRPYSQPPAIAADERDKLVNEPASMSLRAPLVVPHRQAPPPRMHCQNRRGSNHPPRLMTSTTLRGPSRIIGRSKSTALFRALKSIPGTWTRLTTSCRSTR